MQGIDDEADAVVRQNQILLRVQLLAGAFDSVDQRFHAVHDELRVEAGMAGETLAETLF